MPNAESPSMRQIRVLILDDSTADAELIVEVLCRAGYDVLSLRCDRPEIFQREIKAGEFDVIFCDHNLINWTGADALQILRRMSLDIPFIVVTGTLGDERAVDYLKEGAADYVLKDHLERLPHAIARVLEERTQREEVAKLQEASERAARALRESESQLKTLVQTIPDPIWLKDLHGTYIGCNRRLLELMGVEETEFIGKKDSDFMPAELAKQNAECDQRAIEIGEAVRDEEWLSIRGRGLLGLFETYRTPMKDPSGNLLGIVAIARDVTERFKTEEELRVAACAFEAQEGILITDANQVIQRVNRAFSEITGYAGNEVVGRTPRILSSNHHEAAFYRAMWEQIRQEGGWQGEIWNRRKNGEIYAQWLTITAVKGKSGDVTHYVGTMLDITAKKKSAMEIERLALYDLVTQLPNRRLFLDRLQQAITASRRHHSSGVVLFIDLDNFKQLNDTLGHDIGDQMLVEVGRQLSGCLRSSDTIARFGGDEFVVLAEDLGKNSEEVAGQARAIATKVLATLSKPFVLQGTTHYTSASIGITIFPGSATSVDELMKQADIAMYQAKADGRNTLCLFEPGMQAQLGLRAILEADLRAALQRSEFVLHFQPQFNTDHRIIGAEALVRWDSSSRGFVSPADFIGIAEETGLILPLGCWVLESACRHLARWRDVPGLSDLRLSVNVSARQFRQPDFVACVLNTLQATGAPASRLMLELTESLVIRDIAGVIEKMDALKTAGVGFAIDDFGTGFSSLSYLTRFPLDQLKIDRSFVRELPGSANDAIVAQMVLQLGRSLGLTVLAEGVETVQQHDFLQRNGCLVYQGYLFGRPMEIQQFEDLVGEARGRKHAEVKN